MDVIHHGAFEGVTGSCHERFKLRFRQAGHIVGCQAAGTPWRDIQPTRTSKNCWTLLTLPKHRLSAYG
jgi:hypothetical protein